jgi:hypothetical protein
MCLQNTFDPSFTRVSPHFDLIGIKIAVVAMLDIEDFESAFPDGVTYSDGVVQAIQEFQHALGGKTFFERLLVLLKVQGTSIEYVRVDESDKDLPEDSCTPPGTPSSFAICTSALSTPRRLYTTSTA